MGDVEQDRSGRAKVLLLAYAVSPIRGSEPGVGWHRAVESAKYFDTWVISVKDTYSEEVRHFLETEGRIPGLHFAFVPKGFAIRLLMRIPGGAHLGYNLWHRRALQVARRLHRQIGFDLVHQVNFCGYREPGYLWKLDAPFVWGPIGGTQNYPWRFLGEAGIARGAGEALRNVLNWLQLRYSHRVRKAARRARLILAANTTVQRDFVSVHGIMPVLLPDTGIDAIPDAPDRRDSASRALRILWSGVLGTHKALSLLIKALAQMPGDTPCEVRILGCGSCKSRWRRLARRIGIDDRLTWMGWLPHHQVFEQYAWADVFVFTSLRDTTGTVVLEAMALGLPVICLDHQGVRDAVTDECGIKIPVTNPREVVTSLRDALVALAKDGPRRVRLSEGARRRAGEYLWSRQGDRLATLYLRVLEEGNSTRNATSSATGPDACTVRALPRMFC